jgi:hypothetical protein
LTKIQQALDERIAGADVPRVCGDNPHEERTRRPYIADSQLLHDRF